MVLDYLFKHNLTDSPVFSNVYLKLREKFLTENYIKEHKTNYSVINEKILKIIWYEQKFDKKELKTTDNNKLSILTPGDWNLFSGPDFYRAKIKIGNRTLTGDIEIDKKYSDWKTHKHFIDKKFKNVILHIFFIDDRKNQKQKYVFNFENEPIHQLNLSDYIKKDMFVFYSTDFYPWISNTGGLGECAKKINTIKYDYLFFLFRSAGDARILLKSYEFNKMNDMQILQVFYEKIAEALGYSENKIPLKTLIELIQVKKLKKLISDIKENRAIILQSLFFKLSNLIPQNNNFDFETKEFIDKLNTYWNTYFKKYFSKIEDDRLNKWIFYGIRPLNFPTRRIAGLSYLIDKYLDKDIYSIIEYFTEKLQQDNMKFNKIASIFTVSPQGYFGLRTNFNSKILKTPKYLVGNQRALNLIVNVLLPVSVFFKKRENDTTAETLLHKFYDSLPVIEKNIITKIFIHKLTGNIKKLPINKERIQQGILQIYNDFCISCNYDCKKCKFLEILDLEPEQINF